MKKHINIILKQLQKLNIKKYTIVLFNYSDQKSIELHMNQTDQSIVVKTAKKLRKILPAEKTIVKTVGDRSIKIKF